MIVLGIAGIAVLIIIYLYVRSDGLRRELMGTKRQLSNTSSELKQIAEILEVMAFEQQMAMRKNLNRAKGIGHPDANVVKYTEALIDVMVNVTVEAAKGHKNVHEAFKKQLGRSTDISHEDFNEFMSAQEEKIKMEWHKKSVLGYLTVCRLMVEVVSGVSFDDASNA